MGRKIEAIPTATDAITKVKERMRMRTRLHMTGTNDTTQVKNHIFEWKDIGGKVPSGSPRRLDAYMRPQTPSNGSDIGSTSPGIDAVSIVAYSEDSDGPMRVSSGIDAASLSDSSIGSKVLESLPSSSDVRERDDEGIEARTAPQHGVRGTKR
jgi:hypothetical protein